ncbi:vitamin K epoxide reductase family protein [Streptomyces flavofungini]|uniref:Vitamin K epoxide reductase family protein n=1 Tax=Streptomyces flavofungini TaxID=68200 RepID=A0ABS0WYK6_9ACTN|nr:vitamin K epoxide reductase family protein [Streptomyces flavofungini]MBJ3805891.1 vitamin K epoxide reductase family protein [Streptomyces flavofungini]GHC75887.1 membrane protein [Streptomyces flavofungini]
MRAAATTGRVPVQASAARPAAVPRPDDSRAAGGGRGLALLLVLTAAAGLLASWVITLDKFKLLADPDYVPGCSMNPVVSCGSIMKSEQAAVFGFPNPMLGLAAYGVVLCAGVGLLAGARFPRWYWLTLNAGTVFGVVFCTWLQFQSLYRIHALCLWCCLAWAATLLMFWYVTSHNVRQGFLPAPTWLRTFMNEFTWVFPVLHSGVIGMLILTRWWDFWMS